MKVTFQEEKSIGNRRRHFLLRVSILQSRISKQGTGTVTHKKSPSNYKYEKKNTL